MREHARVVQMCGDECRCGCMYIVMSLAAQHASMQEADEPRCRGEGYGYLADDRPSGPLVWRQIEKRSVLSERTVDRI